MIVPTFAHVVHKKFVSGISPIEGSLCDVVRKSFESQAHALLTNEINIQTVSSEFESVGPETPLIKSMKKTGTFFNKEKKESIKLNVQDINELSAPFISDASDAKKKPAVSKFK